MTDVVYLVRRGDRNEELRYSLRSLVNVPHDRVWFVGHLPRWVQGVKHLDGNPSAQRAVNVFRGVLKACECDEMSDDIIIMNDDFMVLQPWRPEAVYRCSLDEHVSILGHRRDAWAKSVRLTRDWLTQTGVTEPRSYELHRPVLVNRQAMGDLLRDVGGFGHPTPPQWRSLYGNHHTPNPVQMCDGKVYRWRPEHGDRDVLSTDDSSWVRIQPHIAERFPHPSPYEVTR
jgi:hypothetical protein